MWSHYLLSLYRKSYSRSIFKKVNKIIISLNAIMDITFSKFYSDCNKEIRLRFYWKFSECGWNFPLSRTLLEVCITSSKKWTKPTLTKKKKKGVLIEGKQSGTTIERRVIKLHMGWGQSHMNQTWDFFYFASSTYNMSYAYLLEENLLQERIHWWSYWWILESIILNLRLQIQIHIQFSLFCSYL